MRCALFFLCGLASLAATPVMLDRIAIVVGKAIIKDSDIDRDVRVTDFLNDSPVVLSTTVRRTAASRLIDQTFIRDEIIIGDYPRATVQDAAKQLAALKKRRGEVAFDSGLERDGLVQEDVLLHLQWQLTVLNFIDARFKPAAYVSDEEVTQYYNQHFAELKRQYPDKSSLNDLRGVISDRLASEKVNKLFFDWLDDQRKNGHVDFHEASLR